MDNIKKQEVITRYEDLLITVTDPEDLGFNWEEKAPGQGNLVVVSTDKDGLLTVLAGLLTSCGAEIVSGDIISVVDDHNPSQRKILDILYLKWPEEEIAERLLGNFKNDLEYCNKKIAIEGIESVRNWVIDKVAARFSSQSATKEKMLPVEIEIDNDCSETDTVLRIQSQDTPGFLFAFSNALSLLSINIDRATIRTASDLVQNVFYVRDLKGRKIIDQEKLDELRFICALIKQFAYLLPNAPNPGQAISQFRDFASKSLLTPQRSDILPSMHSEGTLQMLAEVMGVSRFLWEDFLRMQYENLIPLIQDPTEISGDFNKEALSSLLHDQMATDDSMETKVKWLNQIKDREMFRIDLRHITRTSNDVQFARELSDLADVIVAASAELSHAQLAPRFGQPLVEGKPCPWAIFAAGKFGGREMGFASDLELLFVYEGAGETSGRRAVSNSTYFENFVRTFLKNLHVRKEGIFEVDLRLRPFGNKGPLASSLNAMHNYYIQDGQAESFERMAMIKLRPVIGDEQLCKNVMQVRDDFVYSGSPFDIKSFLNLRNRMISELTEASKINVKYSAGTLVDIEFYLQVLQIKHGATNPVIRNTNSMEALKQLQEAGVIDAKKAECLRRAYSCFRRTIDALRAVRGNAKDLVLPESNTPDYNYLARRLNFVSAEAFSQEIEWCRNQCRDLLEKLTNDL